MSTINSYIRKKIKKIIYILWSEGNKINQIINFEIVVVVHMCNPSLCRVEAGQLQVQGQLGPHGKQLELCEQCQSCCLRS